MASKSLSGLTGTQENHLQGPENSIRSGAGKQDHPGNSPTQEGFMVHYDGPTDHTGLLEFYFGHPSSTVKTFGSPEQSKW